MFSDRLINKPQMHYQFGWFDWFCLWYPPGWLILFNRHWQHYHADPDGWNMVEYLLFLLPGGFYLALLLRWLRLGCRAPRETPQSIDPHYQFAFQQEILTPIVHRHFRAELHHLENLPETGRLIIAMNHAGMCFPWDLVSLGVLLTEARGWFPQPLAHEIFFDHPWLRWWLPVGWSEALGSVRAEPESFEAALQSQAENAVVLYAPEGWRGLAKGWRNRYQLATFDPSFVQLSDRYQIPILPVVCMGSENLHPWTVNIKRMARWLGLPMFPLSLLVVVFILFPSMGVWANRTHLRYFIQPLETPFRDRDWQPNRTTAYRKAQALRSHLQTLIDQLRSVVCNAAQSLP
ncbi:1-acyl-sn-glycerol-3-phosphate acyltransferase [Oscillatoria sp. FACHB-1407]|uniref:1-acyl-sn-glycerol-3-phosphate acyltransferase n=1 Tax=Oscillatoria sp. FACHB-1407 TaxID=2692847 RepID=UPI001F550008|nr:1-acyl-sn-glycerol-3-phosphate acyltransferase [Oscillatoria sp. FACHB-1407]